MAEPPKYPWKDNDLRPIKRVITEHDEEGKSVFSSVIPEELPGKSIGAPALFRLGYCTDKTPISFNDNQDVKTYVNYLQNPPGIVIPSKYPPLNRLIFKSCLGLETHPRHWPLSLHNHDAKICVCSRDIRWHSGKIR
jgi:hypothetical protein